ncbi:unnamed protein product [Lampetra fluviatilis]
MVEGAGVQALGQVPSCGPPNGFELSRTYDTATSKHEGGGKVRGPGQPPRCAVIERRPEPGVREEPTSPCHFDSVKGTAVALFGDESRGLSHCLHPDRPGNVEGATVRLSAPSQHSGHSGLR